MAGRSRLGLVVRGEEWQGGRGLERLVTVRLGEAVVARRFRSGSARLCRVRPVKAVLAKGVML